MSINANFSRVLSLLRQEKGISQRKAAAELGISQALLSHYENGIREPGLNFVAKACDYYHVSADYLLGRTLSRDGAMIEMDEMVDASEEKESLKGGVKAKLQKKLLVNTTSVGMRPHTNVCAVSAQVISRCRAVFDAVYNPADTLLLQRAREQGVTAVPGMGMLVCQAAYSHKIWYGTVFDPEDLHQLIASAQAELPRLFGGREP